MEQKLFTKTHGLRNHPLYNVWARMKQKCYNQNHHRFEYYGGRGIIMCDEWKVSFKKFHDWAIVNGYKLGLELDRANTNGNYEPTNCRFVDQAVNKRNRRWAAKVVYNGEEILVLDLADKIGMKYKTIKSRYLRGWTVDEIVNQPLRDSAGRHYAKKR